MITHESSLESYIEQFEYVLKHYNGHGLSSSQFDNIILAGLGGSGIGAMIAKSWFFDKISLPLEVINDYHLPHFVGPRTLVVLNSYSGNTEETLNLFHEARAKNAHIICISSGGQLAEIANANQVKHYPLPTGYQPRMTIGYGLSFLLMIVGDLCGIDYTDELKDIVKSFPEQQDRQIDSANEIFQVFKNNLKRKFVLISDREFTPIAVRFAQQINENAKLEAFVNTIPEANHNVLESYVDRMDTNFILLYSEQNPRVTARFDFLMSHLEMENNKILPLVIPEYSVYAIFDVIYRLDWVSVMMANELDAPLMEVPNISNLKDFLSAMEVFEDE